MNTINDDFIEGSLFTIKLLSKIDNNIFIRHIVIPKENTNYTLKDLLLRSLLNATILSIKYNESVFYLFSESESDFPDNNSLIDQYWKDGIVYFFDFESSQNERYYSIVLNSDSSKNDIHHILDKYRHHDEDVQISEWGNCWIARSQVVRNTLSNNNKKLG